jgi:DNA processing protein
MSIGCHEEIRNGRAILATNVTEVIDAVGRIGEDLAPPPPPVEESPRDRLSALERQVLDGVRPRKILTAEEIAAVVGVSGRDARRTLPALELAGFVTPVGAGYRLFRKTDAKPPDPPPPNPPIMT